MTLAKKFSILNEFATTAIGFLSINQKLKGNSYMIYRILQKIKTLKDLLDQIETVTVNDTLIVDIGLNKKDIGYVEYQKDIAVIYAEYGDYTVEIFRIEIFEEISISSKKGGEASKLFLTLDGDVLNDLTQEKDDVELVLTFGKNILSLKEYDIEKYIDMLVFLLKKEFLSLKEYAEVINYFL